MTNKTTIYLHDDVGEEPNYAGLFISHTAPLASILNRFHLSIEEITGIGAVVDVSGDGRPKLTHELVIPGDGKAYKVGKDGKVELLASDDLVSFLEVGEKRSASPLVQFKLDVTGKDDWKQKLREELDPGKSYIFTIKGDFKTINAQHPGPESPNAIDLKTYGPSAVAHDFDKLTKVTVVGFFGGQDVGFRNAHGHVLATSNGVLVGGHLNTFESDEEKRGVWVEARVATRRVMIDHSSPNAPLLVQKL